MESSRQTNVISTDATSTAAELQSKIAQLEHELTISRTERVTVWEVAIMIVRLMSGVSDKSVPSCRTCKIPELEPISQPAKIEMCTKVADGESTRTSAIRASAQRITNLLNQFDRLSATEEKHNIGTSAGNSIEGTMQLPKPTTLPIRSSSPSLLDIESMDLITEEHKTGASILGPKEIKEKTTRISVPPRESEYIVHFTGFNQGRSKPLQRSRVCYTDVDSQPRGPPKLELDY